MKTLQLNLQFLCYFKSNEANNSYSIFHSFYILGDSVLFFGRRDAKAQYYWAFKES